MLWRRLALVALVALLATSLRAEPPSVSYIFPAGGQRGTSVPVRIGGHFLHDRAALEIRGPGIAGPQEIVRTPTIWFEGPLIRQPASQQKEDYPQDYAATLAIAADAPLGSREWRVWNGQGVVPWSRFIVGDLPEVVEQEAEGEALATEVALPVTINGRIFPREDADLWSFTGAAGQSVVVSVAARELGSPLEALVEVLDEAGRAIAESSGQLGADPQLQVQLPAAGRYAVRIRDIKAGGLQHFVYRLTLTSGPWLARVYPLGGRRGSQVELLAHGQSLPAEPLKFAVPDAAPGIVRAFPQLAGQALNGVLFDIDEVDELRESEPNDDPATGLELPFPAVANGRIDQPGDVDRWWLAAKKGEPVRLEIRAARLGSPLDATLVVSDAAGKELARAEDGPGNQPDGELVFNPPADGRYCLAVSERFASRGGPAFAYRLKATAERPDFDVTFDLEALAIDVGAAKSLPVKVARRGGFKGPLAVQVEGLPAGVTVEPLTIKENQPQAALGLQAAADAPVSLAQARIVATVEGAGEPLARVARRATAGPDSFTANELTLAVTLPTPFSFRGTYEFKYIPRGTMLRKTFQLDRGGFEGPLEVRLADRQGRHLQGVTGPALVIPPGAEEFEYPVALPPWMELGRTCRVNLMLTGEVRDSAGKAYKVSFATQQQNEQLIALVSPSLVRLIPHRGSLAAAPNTTLELPLAIKRDRAADGPLLVELVIPAHMRDLAADPVEVPAGGESALVRIRIGPQPGPLNMPLTLRARGDYKGYPLIAETPLELIAAP